ncbi:MAG: transposase [Cyanobacteria bacterium P01_D01_bin.73]
MLEPWPYLKALTDRQPAPFDAGCKYGISSKQVSALCRGMRGQIKGFWTHRKKGNYRAQLPMRFRSVRKPSGRKWDVLKAECRWVGTHLQLGSKTQIGGFVTVSVPPKMVGMEVLQASISFDDGGDAWIHLSYSLPKPDADEVKALTNVAAVDPGQLRAMVVADSKGRIRSVSGHDILAVKRQRERSQKAINRKRARVFRGQVRYYLSSEERETMTSMEAKSSGAGTKYAHQRIAAHRRREQLERHVAAGNSPETFRYRRRYSNRDWKLKHALGRHNAIARRKLRYANHCVTKRIANWCIAQDVGTLYFGDVFNIPKGRKKGETRKLQSKRNALWEVGRQRDLLQQKLEEHGATLSLQSERYTSQTCPKCGARRKPRGRLYVCRSCGWTGDRDGVGAANILSDALDSKSRILPGRLKPLSLSPVMSKKGALVSVSDAPSRFDGLCSSPESGDSQVRTLVRESGDILSSNLVNHPEIPATRDRRRKVQPKGSARVAESPTHLRSPQAERSHDPTSDTFGISANNQSAQKEAQSPI